MTNIKRPILSTKHRTQYQQRMDALYKLLEKEIDTYVARVSRGAPESIVTELKAFFAQRDIMLMMINQLDDAVAELATEMGWGNFIIQLKNRPTPGELKQIFDKIFSTEVIGTKVMSILFEVNADVPPDMSDEPPIKGEWPMVIPQVEDGALYAMAVRNQGFWARRFCF